MKWSTEKDFCPQTNRSSGWRKYVSIQYYGESCAAYIPTAIRKRVPFATWACLGYDLEKNELVIIPSTEQIGAVKVVTTNGRNHNLVVLSSFLRYCGVNDLPGKGRYRAEIINDNEIHVYFNDKV